MVYSLKSARGGFTCGFHACCMIEIRTTVMGVVRSGAGAVLQIPSTIRMSPKGALEVSHEAQELQLPDTYMK